MLGNNLPFWFQQFRYADGRPLAGGKLYTYVSESSIPKKVYYDVEMTQPATNPVILDSAGYLPEIFLESGLYTFELKDANDILIARRDNINSIDFDSIFQPFGYFLPLSGGTLSGTLSGTNITISGGVSATKFSMANAEFIPGTRQHSIRLVGNDGTYSDYTSTIGFGVQDKAVIGTLDGESLNLSASFIELEGENTYIKKGNFVVGEITEQNNVTLQDWGFLDQRGDARFDGTLSAKEGIIIPGKTNSDILVADGSTINLSGISASPYFTAGVIDGTLAEIVDNGDGSFTVQPCNVSLFPTTNYVGNLKQYYVAGGTFTATDLAEEYVCVNYNSGSPYMYLETNKANINEANIICLYIIWRQGNVIHSIQTDSKGIGLSNKTSFAITNTTPYRKSIDGGLVVSETMSPHERTILVTSAIVYAGVIPIDVKSFKSNTDTLTMVFKNSGNWVFNNAPYYNNSEYFDGTSIQFMNPNKYSPRWIYRSIGDTKQVFYILGNEYSTIAAAKEELPPSDLPKVVKNHCMLVARIIIQNGASSGIVNNISDINLSYASVSNHNDLDGLQGGDIGNYYHVSATTFGYLSGVSADIQEQINSKADISAVPTITDIGNYLPLSGGAMTGHLSARNIIPEASFVYSLGNSASRWTDFYCRVLTADSLTTTIDTVTSRMKLILGDGDNFGTNGQLQFKERSTFYAPSAVSGDFYSDGNNLHFYDKSKTKRTLAYTSDLASSISGYLPLSGGTISGQLKVSTISASGNISASSFIKNGGTSSQFLKANGSVDSNSYALNSSLNNYLPLSGGTLTGQLKGTSISANIFVNTSYIPTGSATYTLNSEVTATAILFANPVTATLAPDPVGRTFDIIANQNISVTIPTGGILYYNGLTYGTGTHALSAGTYYMFKCIANNFWVCK